MIQGPRTCISPTDSPSHGSVVPASSTRRRSTPTAIRPVRLRQVHCSDSGVRAGTCAIAASGEVSVIPQACTMCMPWSASKRCISFSGTADPPQATSRSDVRSVGCSST